MTKARCAEAGFSLVVVLLLTTLLISLCLYLCLLIGNQSHMVGSSESQLYSMILAENGIEYARSILPRLNINELLKGPDNQHSGDKQPEWRSPLSFEEAWEMDPETWSPACDDGWPAFQGNMLLSRGYTAPENARFYIRFSNNPDEPAADDQDHIVLVRSMGIAPSKRQGLFATARNNVTLVEATLRQETVFDLPAALVLFGEEMQFEWEGDFQFDGDSQPAVACVGPGELQDALLEAVAGIANRFNGAGAAPSVSDVTDIYRSSPVYGRVFRPVFWSHFLEQLPGFAEDRVPGLRFCPEGGQLEGEFEGILVATGDLALSRANVRGLLLHLGQGSLTLEDSTVTGAIWMSNSSPDEKGKLTHSPLRLKVLGPVQVSYDAGAIRDSLALLPPTQLGWRILFPEMEL